MRVIVSGATGFIGRALCRELCSDYDLVVLSRDAAKADSIAGGCARVVEWDARSTGRWAEYVEGAHAIVNLAGENVASGRWTAPRKDTILQSRAWAANAVLDAVIGARNKPAVVIQASAIGYYGSRGDEILDETATSGTGFLAEVCRRAESVADKIEAAGVRCAMIRTGVVLGDQAGALPMLMRPFRLYAGGWLGSGRQWFSWISLVDEVRAIRFLMENRQLKGAVNLTAPNPVPMKQFCRTLGDVMHRPAWTAVPGFVVRRLFGEMADEVLLASQRVLPGRLVEAGFQFRHPTVENALRAIVIGEEVQ
ncbi:MAG: TIGR01777 family oxidoreductase [Sedimentisphaerales bacterium]|nr:TIGR01777 family oxidoreductase [Sedimentisphaerales bacterium]